MDGAWARQNPEQMEAIIPIAIAIAGAVGAFLPDNRKPVIEDNQGTQTDEDNPKPSRYHTPPKELEEPTSGWGDKS